MTRANFVVKRASKLAVGCGNGILAATLLCLICSASFARSRNRSPIDQSIAPLQTALQANDLDAAQLAAASIYQQATNTLALQSSDPTVIIDPVMVAETVEFSRTKAAFEIAQCFYNHAQLDFAKQWATTGTTGSTLAEEYVRKATVLLGQIATAVDKDDEAIADFLSVIQLPNRYREQPAAYAGLVEVLLLQKRDDLVEQWLRDGQSRFEGAGDLQLLFLREAVKTLRRRNHPLWRTLDQQIVDVAPTGDGGKRKALFELASDARKFGRWAEAETNYAAICASDLKSAEETVNAHLFLAKAQAKQGRDYSASIQSLESRIQNFAKAEDKEYGHYRLGKFYEEQARFDAAATNYQLLATSTSTSTWAAASLHQLAALKERQGDLKTALQLYLQYPKKYPGNDRLVVQAYGNALNVTETLGQTNVAEQIVGSITNRAAKIQDYNVHLNLAFYFKKREKQQIAQSYLESSLPLARSALGVASDRSLIHFRVLRRLFDFAQYQRVIDYFAANASDLVDTDSPPNDYQLESRCYKAMALASTGHREQALDELRELLDQAHASPDSEANIAGLLGLYYNTPKDRATAAEFFEWAARKYPDHPWANLSRLELAIQRFNAGDYAAAQKLTDDITNSLGENSKMSWIRATYWGAVYLRGCCLQLQGNTGKAAELKQLALTKTPDLRIQDRLRTK